MNPVVPCARTPLRPTPLRPITRLPRRGQARASPPFINLCGDYRFLRAGYWALVDAELGGVASRPTPLDAITAQNVAAALLVAGQNAIPCATWRVARRPEDIAPPSVLIPVAGQTDAWYRVNSPRSAAAQWRSASQNGTRPVVSVAAEGRLRSFKTIVGVTTSPHYELAWRIWSVFRIPLATVWYLESDDGPRFVAFDPLPLHALTERELRLFEEVSKRPMSPL